jgi:hypothetical protein
MCLIAHNDVNNMQKRLAVVAKRIIRSNQHTWTTDGRELGKHVGRFSAASPAALNYNVVNNRRNAQNDPSYTSTNTQRTDPNHHANHARCVSESHDTQVRKQTQHQQVTRNPHTALADIQQLNTRKSKKLSLQYTHCSNSDCQLPCKEAGHSTNTRNTDASCESKDVKHAIACSVFLYSFAYTNYKTASRAQIVKENMGRSPQGLAIAVIHVLLAVFDC